MPNAWIDTNAVRKKLTHFFKNNRSDIREFGNTVNQTFEAFVFASLISWYADAGWKIEIINPNRKSKIVRLKFSTRGRPSNYTYAICTKNDNVVEIRHGLRVATKYHLAHFKHSANIVLDVAVIRQADLSAHKTDNHIEQDLLITFAEAKHMSAYAELVANFVGLVHEMSPQYLENKRDFFTHQFREHPAPFLYVSGYLYPTAKGIEESIRYRQYDIDIYDHNSGAILGLKLS